MTEMSQSHGTLSTTTEDCSTPSNHSEYFSVRSSLDILNANEEVYYSMDEDEESKLPLNHFSQYRKYECHEFIKEDNIDLDDFIQLRVSNSNETIPGIFLNETHVKNEDWDKVCDNFNSVISQESISTDEEDMKNNSTLTDSVLHDTSLEKHDSDNEENASLSVNNMMLMSSSVIEGELSENNDIEYESSVSPEPCINDQDEENLSIVDKNEPEARVELSILEMVRKIEFSELYDKEPSISSDKKENNEVEKEDCEVKIEEIEVVECLSPIVEIIVDDQLKDDIEISNCIFQESDINRDSPSKFNEINAKTQSSEIIQESPTKRLSLCCSMRRKKVKNNKLKSKPSRSKSLFSFLKFFKKEKNELKSPKSLPELHISKKDEEFHIITIETDEYRNIPYMDADVGSYSDSYIPLAIHEDFCE